MLDKIILVLLYLSEMEVVFTKAKNLSGTAALCYICIDYIYRDTENGATQFFWLKLITGNWESFPKIFIYPSHSQKIAQYWGLKPTTRVWVTWIRPMSIYVWTMLWHFLLSTACFDKLTCCDKLTLMHNAITY